MYKVDIINKPIFINKPEYDCSLRNYNAKHNPNETLHLYATKKTRGICVGGVMKNEKCYHVVLDSEYLNDFKSRHKDKRRYTLDDVVTDIFANKDVATQHSDGSEAIIFDNSSKFGHGANGIFEPYNPSDTYEFDCYMVNDFVECDKTAKEIERIKKEEERKKTENFNSTMLLDTVITTLKEKGIDIRKKQNSWRHNGRAYMSINDKKDWNKLILLAINNYLNDIAKEQGFKINQPKFMANANITYESPLFFVDDIEILK